MAQVLHCDICREVIKGKLFILVVREFEPGSEFVTKPIPKPLLKALDMDLVEMNPPKTTQIDLCSDCNSLILGILKMRLKEIENLKKEVVKILNPTKGGEA